MERLHIRIYGNVVGVNFRSFVKHHADRLGIPGYAKNIGNEVEVILEGNPDLLKKLLEIISRGPPNSKVTKVDITKEEFKKEFSSFEIRF